MSEKNDDNGIQRRTVLKSLGAGAAVLGMSGLSVAQSGSTTGDKPEYAEMRNAADEYASDGAIQQALVTHAGAVQQQLAREGISTELSMDEFHEVRSFPDHHEGVASAHIVAESDELELHVFPHAEHAFAFEKTDDGMRRFDADGTGPKPLVFCGTSTSCDGYCDPINTSCGFGFAKGTKVTQRCCQYADGSTDCTTTNSQCTNDCPGTSC